MTSQKVLRFDARSVALAIVDNEATLTVMAKEQTLTITLPKDEMTFLRTQIDEQLSSKKNPQR